MGIRSLEGLVLASDTTYQQRAEGCQNIRQVADFMAVLVEPDVGFGTQLLEAYLAQLKGKRERVDEFGTGCQEFILGRLAEKKRAPASGMIFAGIEPEPRPEPQAPKDSIVLMGIHAVSGYKQYNFFGGNVFGGGYNSIARYLDGRMSGRDITLIQAKHLAAFYITQSQIALAPRLENYLAMATITYRQGFQWVEEEELQSISEEVSYASTWLRSQCARLFLVAGLGRLEEES